MSEMDYVYLGYVVCFGGLAGYALHVLRRGRRLSRSLPAGERTWR